MRWAVRYLTASANIEVRTVEAPSKDLAASVAGILESRVLDIRAANPGFFERLTAFKPTPYQQISTLAAVGSSVSAGNSADSAFTYLKMQNPKFAKVLDPLPMGLRTSDRLEKLNFDPTVIMMLRAGETAGDIADSLTTAAENMSERIKTKQLLSKGIKPAMLMMILMSSALFGMPELFCPVIDQIKDGGGLTVDTNLATDLMYMFRWIGENLWGVGIGLAVTGFFFRRPIWEKIRFWPFFSQLEALDRCSRAVNFLSAYIPLDASGIGSTEILRSFYENSGNRLERELLDKHIKMVAAGKPMSECFDVTRYPDIFINAIRGIEKAPDASIRFKTLTLIKKNILVLTDITADKLLTTFKISQWIMLLLVIGMMVLGVYLPILNIHQAPVGVPSAH